MLPEPDAVRLAKRVPNRKVCSMSSEPFGYSDRWWDRMARPGSRFPAWLRFLMLAIVAAVVVAIIARSSGSMERETQTAFTSRFGQAPGIKADPQHRRGVWCGTYTFASGSSGRFLYVSHFSAERPELDGLHLSGDPSFSKIATEVCG